MSDPETAGPKPSWKKPRKDPLSAHHLDLEGEQASSEAAIVTAGFIQALRLLFAGWRADMVTRMLRLGGQRCPGDVSRPDLLLEGPSSKLLIWLKWT